MRRLSILLLLLLGVVLLTGMVAAAEPAVMHIGPGHPLYVDPARFEGDSKTARTPTPAEHLRGHVRAYEKAVGTLAAGGLTEGQAANIDDLRRGSLRQLRAMASANPSAVPADVRAFLAARAGEDDRRVWQPGPSCLAIGDSPSPGC
jgi:hypothetical protein